MLKQYRNRGTQKCHEARGPIQAGKIPVYHGNLKQLIKFGRQAKNEGSEVKYWGEYQC